MFIKTYLKYLIATAENNYLNNLANQLSDLNLSVDSFLDVGCYQGLNTVRMAKALNARKICGFDINPEALKIAGSRGVKSFIQNIHAEKWDISEDTYDFIYSNQVIEHLHSVDNFIINIKNILKNGGYALISTENLAGWHNIFSLILGFQPFSSTNICTKRWSIGNPFSIVTDGHADPHMVHRAVFTFYALKDFLQNYDLEIIKPITAGYYPFPNKIGNFLAKMDPRHSVYIAFLVKNHK